VALRREAGRLDELVESDPTARVDLTPDRDVVARESVASVEVEIPARELAPADLEPEPPPGLDAAELVPERVESATINPFRNG
jgi:hypothetical protein